MFFWFLGTFFTLLKLFIDLNLLLTAKQQEDPNKKDKTLDVKILNCYLNIFGKIGDLFPSSQGSNIALHLFGKPWSESTVGLGGLVAALVSLYNAWKNAK